MTRAFHSIFGKSTITDEEADVLFDTYLARKDLTNEKGPEGTFAQINSMRAIIQYLQDHSSIKTCDFRHFKARIFDISTLAEYLKTAHTIIGVAFKTALPESAKESLVEAVKARSGKLKVQYFA